MVTHPAHQQTVLDATDIRELAEFYPNFLALKYRPGEEPPAHSGEDDADWLVLVDHEGRRVLAFQFTEQLTPTTWPSPEVPMQIHLDLIVPDRASLDTAHTRDQALGRV